MDEGKPVPQVARDLDLTESSVRNWVNRARADRGKGKVGVLTSAEREELAGLRKEVRTLRMERDFLKSHGLLRQGEQLSFALIHAQKALYPINISTGRHPPTRPRTSASP